MALRKSETEKKKLEQEKDREQEYAIQYTLKSQRFRELLQTIRDYLVFGYIDAPFCWQTTYRYDKDFIPGNMVLVAGDDSVIFIDEFLEELGSIINYYYREQNEYLYKREKIDERIWWSRFSDSNLENLGTLKNVVCKLNSSDNLPIAGGYMEVKVKTVAMKYYIIFWNLFLAAMDDDIYNEQLATVAELAVFVGNKLSEDCDLECETVEGARFFLHKEE